MAKSKKKENGLAEAFAAADEAKANAEEEKTEKAVKKSANSADALKLRKFGKFGLKGK